MSDATTLCFLEWQDYALPDGLGCVNLVTRCDPIIAGDNDSFPGMTSDGSQDENAACAPRKIQMDVCMVSVHSSRAQHVGCTGHLRSE